MTIVDHLLTHRIYQKKKDDRIYQKEGYEIPSKTQKHNRERKKKKTYNKIEKYKNKISKEIKL